MPITNDVAQTSGIERYFMHLAHDLKLPLQSVKSMLYILELEILEGKKSEAILDIREVSNSIGRMENIVNNMMEYARMSLIPNELSSFVMRDAVEAAIDDDLLGYEITIGESMPVVRADRRRIELLWRNLIVLSIRAAYGERPLRIEIGWKIVEGGYEFYLKDNGIPIERICAERVLQGSCMSDVTCRNNNIGMLVSCQIVSSHGGRMILEPNCNREGVTTRFFLPANLYQLDESGNSI